MQERGELPTRPNAIQVQLSQRGARSDLIDLSPLQAESGGVGSMPSEQRLDHAHSVAAMLHK